MGQIWKHTSRKKNLLNRSHVLQREMAIRILVGFWEHLTWIHNTEKLTVRKQHRLFGKRTPSYRVSVLKGRTRNLMVPSSSGKSTGSSKGRTWQQAQVGRAVCPLPLYTAAAASIESRCRRAFLFQAQLLSPIPKNTLQASHPTAHWSQTEPRLGKNYVQPFQRHIS